MRTTTLSTPAAATAARPAAAAAAASARRMSSGSNGSSCCSSSGRSGMAASSSSRQRRAACAAASSERVASLATPAPAKPSSTSTSSSSSGASDPFAERTAYDDGPLDRLLITLFTRKIADQLGPHVAAPRLASYDDFVRVSREILKGRTTAEQHALVKRVLQSLMPEPLLRVFRRLYPASQLSAQINAFVASLGFYWLVGDTELRTEPVEVAPGVTRVQRSVVHIKKCRYLEASGCVGLCFNMCKVPTQDFFTNEIGLPLTMNPDFETLSCDMIFGQAPPAAPELDPAYGQPCFVPHCSLASKPEACPKVDTTRLGGGGGGGGGGGSSNGTAAV